MSVSTMVLQAGGEPVEAVANAIGSWCRHWPEKVLVRDFGIAPQTAKKWRRGEDMPAGRHLVAMAERWGRPFVDHAFAAVLDEAGLDGRLEALEASFALLRRDLTHDGDAAAPQPVEAAGTPDRAVSPDGGGMARTRGATMATARALIVGLVLGALAAHLVPTLPHHVSDLRADAGDQLRPRPRPPRPVKLRMARTGGRGLA